MRAIALGLTVAGLCATAAAAQDPHIVKSAASECAALANTVIPDVRITQAAAVAASSQPTAVVRVARCRVSGVIGKETHRPAAAGRLEPAILHGWRWRICRRGREHGAD
jgi:hypothetical protein